MTSESETPRITELHVRMDCNGCVHKIKKTLSGIEGIGEVYVDQANHKITVVGTADPERIVKAIRKTKKVPTICSHIDPTAEAQPPAPPAEGEAPPPPADPPSDEPPPADPPSDEPPPAEAAPAEAAPENEAPPAETPAADATVIHMAHDYPYSHHVHRDHWANHPSNMQGVRYDAAPYYAAHSYSHRPSPYISEYGHVSSPVQEGRYYSHDYRPVARGKGDGSQITSMFSDENPNACSIA
ncbi:hypothetical protein QYE76_052696 [Lolium multiflorum]|uniref:HMA domain-containing protein n=1 Tax=Lolium multiflorum TaxID=4521 RepID=A0AAD8WJ58_LOLMU|nr:hypothetical protein QYE76_052696 [Lolium multiflorum]